MSNDFIAYLQELLAGLGEVSARAMFGGYGLYLHRDPHDRVLIGVVMDDGLYLKVDAQTQACFAAEGCAPFVYAHGGKNLTMSYWSVPEAALDSPQAMLPWARLALEAALRKPVAGTVARKRRKPAAGAPKP